jgi:hypothetical protein
VRDQHSRRRTGDPRRVVVLGYPEPPVSQLVGADRERRGVPEGLGGGSGGGDRSDIEDRERYINHKIIP